MLRSPRRQWYLGFWFFASLASFTKGWHGIALSAGNRGVGGYFLQTTPHSLRGLVSWRGALLFALINLPWYFTWKLVSRLPSQSFRCRAAWPSPWRQHARHVLYRCSSLPVHPPATGMAVSVVAGNHHRGSAIANSFPSSILSRSELSCGHRHRLDGSHHWLRSDRGTASGLLRHVHVARVCAGGRMGAGTLAIPSLARPRFPSLLGAGSRLVSGGRRPWPPSANAAALAERATAWTTVINFDRTVWTSLQTTAWIALGGALLLVFLGLVFSILKAQAGCLGSFGRLPGFGCGQRHIAGLALLFARHGRRRYPRRRSNRLRWGNRHRKQPAFLQRFTRYPSRSRSGGRLRRSQIRNRSRSISNDFRVCRVLEFAFDRDPHYGGKQVGRVARPPRHIARSRGTLWHANPPQEHPVRIVVCGAPGSQISTTSWRGCRVQANRKFPSALASVRVYCLAIWKM